MRYGAPVLRQYTQARLCRWGCLHAAPRLEALLTIAWRNVCTPIGNVQGKKEQIGALENQLSYELSENGENFSVGERQMLCMARALLTQTRIVVMDEATASIDHATEKKLQTMIDRDFKDATVLTIAHRLATVLDSDRIMVLSDGNVVEFDSANNLVQNPKALGVRIHVPFAFSHSQFPCLLLKRTEHRHPSQTPQSHIKLTKKQNNKQEQKAQPEKKNATAAATSPASKQAPPAKESPVAQDTKKGDEK
ncbi:Atp-binding protein, partial [Globisporangium splendens]